MDAYTAALTWLSRRELSAKQLTDRLVRRNYAVEEIEDAVRRLRADGTVDDLRVALACARTDAAVRRHGRRRVLRHLQQMGIEVETAQRAVDEVFGELDEPALLDAALDKRLRGTPLGALDARATARLVRHLVSRGFEPAEVFARLRKKDADRDE